MGFLGWLPVASLPQNTEIGRISKAIFVLMNFKKYIFKFYEN